MLLDRYRKQAHNRNQKKVYELIEREYDRLGGCEGYHAGTIGNLKLADEEIYLLLQGEYQRLANTLQLTAAQNMCSKPILAVLGSVLQNKTAEGRIGARWHGGCDVVDKLEALAADRAMQAFAAQYANVQPHSGSTANQIVFKALLRPGDVILSLDSSHGGHPSHGGSDSLAENIYKIERYGVEQTSFVFDYEKILAKAKAVRPKLILCGASAYPRVIDFAKFRTIADEVGAYLLADISHIAGQVIAGVHPSPINAAHVTTTSTYKAGGPRGGLILSGGDFEMSVETSAGTMPLFEAISIATFPGMQGTPYFNNIAGKAVFFKEALSTAYRQRQQKIVNNAKTLAHCFVSSGFDVLSGGTDNHMILIDISRSKEGLSGVIAQQALEQCGIVVDSFRLPFQRGEMPAAGVRLGTPIVTMRGMGPEHMSTLAKMTSDVLKEINTNCPDKYDLKQETSSKIRDMVGDICRRFSLA